MSVEPVSGLNMSEGFQAADLKQEQCKEPTQTAESIEAGFHVWSAQQAMNDFNTGFPLLQSIMNSEAKCYLRHVGTLSTDIRAQFVTALAQYARTKDAEPFPEALRETLFLFLRKRARLRSLRARHIPAPSYISFRHIYEQLHILGKCERRRNSWELRTPSSGYRVLTVVQNYPALAYCHHVYNASGICVLQNVSFLQWYGISDSTIWDYMTGDPDERSLKLLKSVCIRFVASFPDILARAPATPK